MLASLLLLAAALRFTDWRFPRQSNGQLVFAQTYAEGAALDKITLTFPKTTVTLLNDNNYWVVREADYYFANTDLLNRLLTDFNSSTYYSELTYNNETARTSGTDGQGVLLQTWHQDRLLDSIIIGKPAENSRYRFVRPQNRNQIWLVDGSYALPPESYSWIMQPVSELPPELVEKVEADGQTVFRSSFRQPFFNETGIVPMVQPLLEAAAYVNAIGVAAAQNFDESLYPARRSLKFTTFQGLVVGYDLYSDGQSYWLSVSLSATPLPKQAVNAYIRDNRIFYDGWFFKIPSVQGKMLLSLPVM